MTGRSCSRWVADWMAMMAVGSFWWLSGSALLVGPFKIQKRRPSNSSILARGKARASLVGFPRTGWRIATDSLLRCLLVQVAQVRVDLVEHYFCTPSNAIAKMLGHRRCGIFK